MIIYVYPFLDILSIYIYMYMYITNASRRRVCIRRSCGEANLGCGPKNTVNTVIFATRGTKHRKYCGFVLPRRQKQWYLRCFMLGKCPKSVKTQSI